MMELFAFLGLLAFVFVFYKAVITLRFRARVLGIVVNEFFYDAKVPGFQGKDFLTACSLAKSLEGNYYDAAIMFMLSQLDMLNVNETRSRNFLFEKYRLMRNVVSKSTMGVDLLDKHMATMSEREGESDADWMRRIN